MGDGHGQPAGVWVTVQPSQVVRRCQRRVRGPRLVRSVLPPVLRGWWWSRSAAVSVHANEPNELPDGSDGEVVYVGGGYSDRCAALAAETVRPQVGKPLKAAEALAPLLRLSDHADPEVRKTVLTALAGYPWEAVQRAVIARLSDTHWSVRKAAIEVLKHNRDAAAELLLERIAESDTDGTVRRAAKEALGK